ncbi:MAG: metallophosphoesterase [Clostridia bacterium]|nr:metallophosphoesterase [Clostridia bacterium]
MVYVISDLHGYPLEKFKALLETAGFSDDDECYILGDVVDRGDDGARLLEWIMDQPNMIFICGNHEMMMLEAKFVLDEITDESIKGLDLDNMHALLHWQRNGGDATLKGLRAIGIDRARELMEFVGDSSVYEEIEVNGKEYLLTHSGLANFSPDRPIWEYEVHELLWNRPTLDDKYFEDKITIFGHTPTGYLSYAHNGKVLFTDTWIDIDTGASGGNPPTLLRLDDMKEFRIE